MICRRGISVASCARILGVRSVDWSSTMMSSAISGWAARLRTADSMLSSSLRAGTMAEIRAVDVESCGGVSKRVAVRCDAIYHRIKARIAIYETETLHWSDARSRGRIIGALREPQL